MSLDNALNSYVQRVKRDDMEVIDGDRLPAALHAPLLPGVGVMWHYTDSYVRWLDKQKLPVMLAGGLLLAVVVLMASFVLASIVFAAFIWFGLRLIAYSLKQLHALNHWSKPHGAKLFGHVGLVWTTLLLTSLFVLTYVWAPAKVVRTTITQTVPVLTNSTPPVDDGGAEGK